MSSPWPDPPHPPLAPPLPNRATTDRYAQGNRTQDHFRLNSVDGMPQRAQNWLALGEKGSLDCSLEGAVPESVAKQQQASEGKAKASTEIDRFNLLPGLVVATHQLRLPSRRVAVGIHYTEG